MKRLIQNRSDQFQRLLWVDALRGLAILGVVLFHLVWDLEFAGIISGIALHPIWLGFGRTLAGTFMVLVGVSLVLAHDQMFKLEAFAKRLFVLLLAASIITVATWYAFPESFIYFGILHAIAAASLIGIIFIRLPYPVTLATGVVVFSLPYLFSSPAFDPRWFAWIGFAETPPRSNDFVPVFPWTGLSLIGMAAMQFACQSTDLLRRSNLSSESFAIKALDWFGRHSLIIYLVHQPALLAVILPIARLSSG